MMKVLKKFTYFMLNVFEISLVISDLLMLCYRGKYRSKNSNYDSTQVVQSSGKKKLSKISKRVKLNCIIPRMQFFILMG